jgi:hypothetical protein
VISIGEEDDHLRIGHLSFSEFLCDPQRCPALFLINKPRQSQKLAMACFRVMKEGLKFNICNLESSHLLNNEVTDLSRRTEKNISTTLLYSCRFWVAHLRDTAEIDLDCRGILIKEVEDFLYSRLLFWLEVLSLKEETVVANIALWTLASWIQVSKESRSAHYAFHS